MPFTIIGEEIKPDTTDSCWQTQIAPHITSFKLTYNSSLDTLALAISAEGQNITIPLRK